MQSKKSSTSLCFPKNTKNTKKHKKVEKKNIKHNKNVENRLKNEAKCRKNQFTCNICSDTCTYRQLQGLTDFMDFLGYRAKLKEEMI